MPSRFNPNQVGFFMVNVGVKNAHGVATTTHAGNDRIRLCSACELGHLGQAFVANHTLEVANHHGVGMRSCHGADDVKRIVDIGYPVAHCLVQCVL